VVLTIFISILIHYIGTVLNLNPIMSSVSRADFSMYIYNYLKSCLNYDIEKAANEAIEIASNIVSIYDILQYF
jgi:hypothetical protein